MFYYAVLAIDANDSDEPFYLQKTALEKLVVIFGLGDAKSKIKRQFAAWPSL